jgi:hypothetical protein
MGSQVSKPQSAFSLQVLHRLQQNLKLFLDTEKKERNKEEERKTEDEFSLQRIGERGRNKREGEREGGMVRREIGAGRHQKLCAAICVAVATTRWRRQVKSAAPKLDVTPPRRTGTSENVSRPPSSDCVVTSTQ